MTDRTSLMYPVKVAAKRLFRPWLYLPAIALISAVGLFFGTSAAFRVALAVMVVGAFLFVAFEPVILKGDPPREFYFFPPKHDSYPSAGQPEKGSEPGFYLVNPQTNMYRWFDGEQFTTKIKFDKAQSTRASNQE